MQGTVYIVGAGPGDPDLLTIRALRLLESADVVVHDRLVSETVMALVPAGVICIPVGKSSGRHSVPQAEINQILAELASNHRLIVRLKGGDPFVFGRGSEEALFLKERGIAFEIVPGITAALACTAYAGVPLTHRGISRGFRVVTGHLKEDGELDLNWQSLADPETTLVIYMGLASVDRMAAHLIAAGLSASTPAMAIQDGSTLEQHVVKATLASLAARVRMENIQPPAILVIGETVALADELNWFAPQTEYEDESMAVWAGR
ncbi:MAG: hypothetical protein DHS20C01_09620 [marine bacterium B5-7]|nr:MAG: hypothetical protein DHS20C01_09620 [marine bacterium B5-7]